MFSSLKKGKKRGNILMSYLMWQESETGASLRISAEERQSPVFAASLGRKEEGIRFNPFRSAIVNINQLLLLLVPRWNVSLKRWKIKKGKKKISGEESWSECSWTGDIPGTIVSDPLVGLLNSRMGQTIWVCHTHPQHPARPAMLVTKASQVTSLAAIC